MFRNKSAFSMGVLHSLFGLRINDSRYCQKLKQRFLFMSVEITKVMVRLFIAIDRGEL